MLDKNLLELHYSMFLSHVFILKELLVLSAGDFTLYRVVWKRDQVAIKKLVIDLIWSFENDDGISIDEADEEAEHWSTETHGIL